MTAQLTPHHHPCCDTLLKYAAGRLSPAVHLCVATHLTFCAQCRLEMQAYESEAGLGLENLPPEEMDVSCLENLLHKIDESGPPACIDVTIPINPTASYRYPETLAPHIGIGEHMQWKAVNGLMQFSLTNFPNMQARLFKFAEAQDISVLVHDRNLVTLVLDGAINGKHTSYLRGDMLGAQNSAHALRVNTQTLCLVVTLMPQDKPSWWQKLLNCFSAEK